ncbi:hypothetical protein D0T84_00180 [Dysgonomonas sp. 521]|uniref:PCMD domain-containing protein n=1 Tax=Dysgonomonas sp. 521 TaxID=2302932 RepID=UPI0013D4E36C|nr:PCMD domain-containing protein [Dysgonomonas sp. 521]NDV93336.1 hypothetical protein [Dysgonomonas sp. 521]
MRLNPFLLYIIIILGATSCIKDEALNMEADIIDMSVDDDTYITRAISEHTVQLIVSEKADYSRIVPVIEVSPGATIQPASGVAQDFSNDKQVKYTVTSEDGRYYKEYTVTVSSKISLKHTFEDWTTMGTEKAPYPVLSDLLWSNANSGLAILVGTGALIIDQYPTDKTTDCVNGQYGTVLQTIKGTTIFGKDYPIFAGNLFRGAFSANMSNPLLSLKLGQAHPIENGRPIMFNGYYKYTPGEVFTGTNGEVIPHRTDSLSMYATLFKVTKGAAANEEYLDGETIITSDRVVCTARWALKAKDMVETPAINGFTKFSIPFKYTESLDFTKNDYRLTIVLSSSKDGNEYQGAVGSKLVVDDLEVICDPVN